MNPLRTVCLMACLIAASFASSNPFGGKHLRSGNSMNHQLKPSNWISASKLENLPSLDEITLEQLENMPLEEGAKLIDTMHHLSQINHDLKTRNPPSAKDIPVYIIKANGRNISTTLDKLASAACQEPNFGDVETNIIIPGLPQQTHTIREATHKLISAYMDRAENELEEKKERFNKNNNKSNKKQRRYDDEDDSSEEQGNNNEGKWSQTQEIPTPDVVIIAVAENCKNFACVAQMDHQAIGKILARELTQLTEKCDVPSETITLLGQQGGAHIAGACGREYKKLNGQRVRRIVALDPSKKFTSCSDEVDGLARGDADFVDAIHTSAYGLGTTERVGDADFFPNGPNEGVPGAKNVVEASMLATRYFAESVHPGNEHNFPAVAANSMSELRNTQDMKKRVFMGLITKYDAEGVFMLEVNHKSPYGKRVVTSQQDKKDY